MFKKNRFLALDIGASKVVLAEFLARQTGSPELLRYGMSRLDLSPEGDSDASAYVVSAIRDVMREQGIRPAPLGMTISGQAVFPRYVKLPPVARDKMQQMIQYEAEQNVPFPMDEVVWDYELVDTGDENEVHVLLAAVKIENVTRLTDCVQAAGLEPETVDAAPLALYNAVRFNYPDRDGCSMVLDIGARSSNLVFVEGFRVFTRSIPVAGNAMTQEIMKEFDLPFDKAEALKLEHAFVALGGVTAGGGSDIAERISKICRNVLTRVHAEVNRSINFYRSQQGGSSPDRILLAGGSSVIPHLDTFFAEKLGVEVDYLNPFVNIAVGDGIAGERIGSDYHLLGEVAGVALRRALVCPVEINLMPPQLLARKALRRREPFFAVALAGLVLIMLCWWVYFHRMQAMLSSRIEKVEDVTRSLSRVSSRLKSVKEEQAQVRAQVDTLVEVIERRTQWTRIVEALQSCLLEGMWLTAVRPVSGGGGSVAAIEIEGMGFEDKLRAATEAEATAVEMFRDRLRAHERFGEGTEITRQPPMAAGAFAREFTLRVELAAPLAP